MYVCLQICYVFYVYVQLLMYKVMVLLRMCSSVGQKTRQMKLLWSRLNKSANPKLQYLQQLNTQGKIESYYGSRKIEDLEMEDIYFYLINRHKFSTPPLFIRQEIVENKNLDAFCKFFIAQQLQTFQYLSQQNHLIYVFHESLIQLKDQEFVYCLNKIVNFKDASSKLNLYLIQSKINQIKSNQIYIEAVYHLLKLNPKPNINIKRVFQSLQNLSCKHTLFLLDISQKLNQNQQHQKIINILASDACLLIEKSQPTEISYAVSLLKYYPEFITKIQLTNLTPQDYSRYLSITTLNINFHSLPTHFASPGKLYHYQKIINKRIQLKYDTLQSIIAGLEAHQDKNLASVHALIKHISQNNIKDEMILFLTEQLIKQKLNLTKINNQQQIIQKYLITDIFKTFAMMATNHKGSIQFWKYSFIFVYQVISNSDCLKQLQPFYQKKFINYTYQIFTYQPPHKDIENKFKTLALLTFAFSRWRIKEILPITISLTTSRTGDHQLWFAIQRKILQINLKFIKSQQQKKKLLIIVRNFSIMGRGTYKFWSEIKQILTQQQKKEILDSIKNQNAAAYKYLSS